MHVHYLTGASGFIGRRLAAKIKTLHPSVRIRACGRREQAGPWDEFDETDLSAQECEFDLCGVNTVYHLAGKAHALSEVPSCTSGYESIIVGGTRRLVEASEKAGVKRFIYISSVKAIAEATQPAESPICEDALTNPESPYGKSKLKAEELVLRSSIPHVVVLRPAMVYGPGHKGNLVKMANAIRRHRFPPVPENGNRRSMVHVDDVVEACILAEANSDANREVFILADSKARSTRELYNQLRSELGMSPMSYYLPSCLLHITAFFGLILGRLIGRRLPLDKDSLKKLLGSAWYDGTKITRKLGLRYDYSTKPLLDD